MKRLIDADKFIETARSKLDMQDLYLPADIKEFVLDKMPTIDAIPIEFIRERMEGYYKNSYTELGACLETLVADWRKERDTVD